MRMDMRNSALRARKPQSPRTKTVQVMLLIEAHPRLTNRGRRSAHGRPRLAPLTHVLDSVATDAPVDRSRAPEGAIVASSPRVRLQRTDDGTAWDALVHELTAQPAFHLWSWLELQAELNGIVIERLLVLADDSPVGVFPVGRKSARSFEGVGMPFPYLGPLVPPALLEASVAAFRKWQLQERLVFARLELDWEAPADAVSLLNAAGAVAQQDTTLLVDLSHGSVETMRANYSSLRRRDIRRAARDGATVRDALPGEIAELLPQVLDEAFTAHGKPSPYPDDVGEHVERWVAGRTDVGTFTALVDGEPAGVQVVLGGGPYAVAWVGACLRRFRDANPNVLLYDRLLEWAVEHDHRGVDLCGRVDEGVQKYKAAFGAVEHPYTTAESTIVPRALLSGAGALRRLVRR